MSPPACSTRSWPLPEKGIPASLLANAQGIAIVPNVVKGGLGIGIRFGRGILLVRDETGKWRPPSFITLAGGSFGWQIGVQATDVVLVFKNRKSVQTLLSGKLTLGADAAVTAGPVGRQAAAGADVTLRSAVFSYSRSRGLFLGLALDGTAIMIDEQGECGLLRQQWTALFDPRPAAARRGAAFRRPPAGARGEIHDGAGVRAADRPAARRRSRSDAAMKKPRGRTCWGGSCTAAPAFFGNCEGRQYNCRPNIGRLGPAPA